jgi:thiaminase
MSFSEKPSRGTNLSHLLWRQNHDLVGQTLAISFIQKLYDGSIQESRLSQYLQQDKYFQHVVRPYRQFIKGQINRETEFDSNQGKVILDQQIQSANDLGITLNHITTDYIQYILTNANSLSTAAVSLLPCSKLYKFLTRYLSRINPSDKCKQWISAHTYSGYNNNTNQLEYLVDLFQDRDIDKLSKIFRKGLEHEISFFSQVDGNLY